MARKKGEDRDGDCRRGGKAGFAVFRDGSLGIVLPALAAPAFCPKPSKIVGSTQKEWEAHRRRIVGSTQKESTAMLL